MLEADLIVVVACGVIGAAKSGLHGPKKMSGFEWVLHIVLGAFTGWAVTDIIATDDAKLGQKALYSFMVGIISGRSIETIITITPKLVASLVTMWASNMVSAASGKRVQAEVPDVEEPPKDNTEAINKGEELP